MCVCACVCVFMEVAIDLKVFPGLISIDYWSVSH